MKAYGETRIPGTVEVYTPFEANDVNPKDDIDVRGGDTLTIIGRGFPTVVDDIEVFLEDGTECDIQSLTSTMITCIL